MLRRNLVVALVTFAGLSLAGNALAKDVKVPGDRNIQKAVGELFAAEYSDSAGREKILLKIDGTLAKDKKGVALKTPRFWASAFHAGRFAKASGAKPKKVIVGTVEVPLPRKKSAKTKFVYYGGAQYKKQKAFPLLLTILEEGQDPKAFIEGLRDAEGEVYKKQWLLAAVAESKDFPFSKNPQVAAGVLIELRNLFNADSDRWYLQGIGKTCDGVQRFASEVVPDRLAGIVLRNPEAAKTNDNSGLYSTFCVVDDKGKAVADAYAAIDAENKSAPAGDTADAAVLGWLSGHTGRKVPSSYKFETTLLEPDKEGSGPEWTGTLRIMSPGERGKPTKIEVVYDRDKNTASITSENLSEFILYMNDELLDLDKPVSVIVNGEELVTKTFERQMREMFETSEALGEYGRVFPVSYHGVIKAAIAEPEEGKDDGDEKGADKKDGE